MRIERDGFDLHYRIVGDAGPFVVLLSGGPGGDVRHLEPVAVELGRRCRAVLLEQRGTGRSLPPLYDGETISLGAYVADLEALRSDLGAQHLRLVGNSWGMGLALGYAVAHPERVAAIVTVGSGPLTLDDARAMQDNLSARLSSAERQALDDCEARLATDPDGAFPEMMRLQWPVFYYDREKGRTAAAAFRPGDLSFEVLAHAGELLGALAEEVLPHLESVTAPVLLVHGRQDPTPEAAIVEIYRRLPNAELRLLHRCGHEPWSERPEALWKAIWGFFGDLDEGNTLDAGVSNPPRPLTP